MTTGTCDIKCQMKSLVTLKLLSAQTAGKTEEREKKEKSRERRHEFISKSSTSRGRHYYYTGDCREFRPEL